MLFDVGKHCSEQLSVGDFKANCVSAIGPSNISRVRKNHSPQQIADSLQTDLDTAKELIDVCNPNNLMVSSI